MEFLQRRVDELSEELVSQLNGRVKVADERWMQRRQELIESMASKVSGIC